MPSALGTTMLRAARMLTGIPGIISLRRYLRSQGKHSLEALDKGLGYALKYRVHGPIEGFVKVDTIIDRFRRRRVCGEGQRMHSPREEGEVLQRLHTEGLAPRILRTSPRFYLREYVEAETLTVAYRAADRTRKEHLLKSALAAYVKVRRLAVYHDGNPDNILVTGDALLLIDTEYSFADGRGPAVERLLRDLDGLGTPVEELLPGVRSHVPRSDADWEVLDSWLR